MESVHLAYCQTLLSMCCFQDTDIHPHEVHIPQSLKESLEALETQSLHSLVVAVGHAAFTDLGFVLRASKVNSVESLVQEILTVKCYSKGCMCSLQYHLACDHVEIKRFKLET